MCLRGKLLCRLDDNANRRVRRPLRRRTRRRVRRGSCARRGSRIIGAHLCKTHKVGRRRKAKRRVAKVKRKRRILSICSFKLNTRRLKFAYFDENRRIKSGICKLLVDLKCDAEILAIFCVADGERVEVEEDADRVVARIRLSVVFERARVALFTRATESKALIVRA